MVIKTANLNRGDKVIVKISYPNSKTELITLRVVDRRTWDKDRLHTFSTGWLVTDTPFFNTINSLELYQISTTEIVKDYPVEVTLIEIERHKKKWYTTIVRNSLTFLIKKLQSGKNQSKN